MNLKMRQSEIQNILLKNKGRWISTPYLSLKLNQGTSSITRALKQMLKYGEVKKKELPIMKKYTQYFISWWMII